MPPDVPVFTLNYTLFLKIHVQCSRYNLLSHPDVMILYVIGRNTVQNLYSTIRDKSTHLWFSEILSPSSGSGWYVKKVVPAMEG